MNKSVMKVGLLGLGTVGSGTMQIIQTNQEEISRKIGSELRITKASAGSRQERPNLDPHIQLTTDAQAIIADPEIDIVVEVMGESNQPQLHSCSPHQRQVCGYR